ncbi:hypothetical protein DPX16_3041 [Anabarilius grahami]|uniref:LRAT domain-containing protein n=1 Tax=Anabarilius grahami TaxID=495550 RepID=A0A3N0XIR9_ANAGA|nr:hypothetical protein DPX16_3041 [Anabarilius grahami]
MKSLRVKLVLITVLLQLCLSVLEVNAVGRGGTGGAVGELVENENQLRFGDLLVFPDENYNHYAVYVGNEQFTGKRAGQNIFEMNGGGCQFDTAPPPFRRHNYLDPGIATQGKSIAPQNSRQMIETIQDLMNRPLCQTYNFYMKNCEQIATRVRYGKARCNQLGTKVEPLARILRRPNIKRREASAAA